LGNNFSLFPIQIFKEVFLFRISAIQADSNHHDLDNHKIRESALFQSVINQMYDKDLRPPGIETAG